MTQPRIRLFLILGMAVAMLAAILWVGLILSASPVSADDGAPPDGGTTVDEGTPPAETPPATVQTDKADYACFETPVITGSGFAANTEVTITVTTPVGTTTTFTATTDANGNWTANYGGPMGGGTFTVSASEGATTAMTYFTDPVYISNMYSSDASGTPKDSFTTTDTVYVTITTGGSGTNAVDIYVVNDGQWWGVALTDVSSDNFNNVTLPTTAGSYTYALWSSPTVGNYDIVVDENENGWYDWGYGSQDQIDAFDWMGSLTPGFIVTAPTPPTVTGVFSSDASGTEQNGFLTTGDVYAHITTTGGSPGGTVSVNIYVTADHTSWNLNDPLTDVSGGYETVNVPTGGGTFLIWSHFTTAGNYDIVVDVNQNGKYGCGPEYNPDVVDGLGYWNYCTWVNEIGFTVSKANATIVVTPYDVIYNGDPHTATGSATGAYGENLTGLLTLTGTTHTNAGNYPTDPWSFAGNAVYNSAIGTVHDVIHKADAIIVVTPYDLTYDGNPHTATGTATGVKGEDLSSLLNLTGTTHTNAGDYPTDPWTFAGNINYNPDCGTVHDVIHKADAIIVVTPYEVTYDGNPHTATGTATGVNGEDLFSLLNLTGTVHTNAGDYPTDPWTFAGNINYNPDCGTVHDIIHKANAIIVVTPYDVTYDSNPHTATGTATGVNGEDLSSLLNLTGTTHTDAGDYPTDPWTFAGNINYNPDNGTVHDIITATPLAGAPEVFVLVVNWFGIWQDYRVTAAGVLLEDVYLTSADGTATLVIPTGTLVLDADGQPLYLHRDPDITVITAGTPTAPPGTTFVAVYEILPNGTTFKYEEAQLIATYDPTLVPEGSVLVMAYYNEAMGQWVELETAGYVAGGETVPNTVFTHFDHLTYFALLAKLPAE